MTRYLIAAAVAAGTLATAVPAHADRLCVIVHRTHEQSTSICGPYGTPLPQLGCPVDTTVVDVCQVNP
jgi:hypothetical protein